MPIDLLRRERQRQTRLQGKKDLAQRVNHRGTGDGSHRQKEELPHHWQVEGRRGRRGGEHRLLRGQRRTRQVAQHRSRMLCHVGGLSQSGGLEGGGVVGHGGGGEGDALHGELVAFLFEEGGGESGRFDRGRAGLGSRAARTTDLGGELSHLLVEAVVLCLHLRETLNEELVLLLHADLLGLELLHLESLALAGCLSGSAVPENPFYPPLLLLIICFGAFATTVSGGNLHM